MNKEPCKLDISIEVNKPIIAKYTFLDQSMVEGIISRDNLLKIFASSDADRNTIAPTFSDARLLQYFVNAERHEFLLTEPPQVWDVHITPIEDRVPIHLPWIIMHGYIDKNLYLSSTYLYITTQNPFEAFFTKIPLPLYAAPMNNLHDDQRICWGNIKTRISQPNHVIELIRTFMRSEFNDHILYERYRYGDNPKDKLFNFFELITAAQKVFKDTKTPYVVDVARCKHFTDMTIGDGFPRSITYKKRSAE